MVRNFIGSGVLALFACGVVLAQVPAGGGKDQMTGGKIMAGTGGKLTYHDYDTTTQKFGEQAKPLPNVPEDVKVYRVQGNQKIAVPGGLKGAPFQNIGPKGLYATWTLKGGQVSEIYLWDDEQAFQKGLKAAPGGTKE
jgi:hypothetical protein